MAHVTSTATTIQLSPTNVNGTARLLTTVLGEKVQEAPWKSRTLSAVARGTVCVHAIDRGEKAYIEDSYGDVAVRSLEGAPPRVTIKLPANLIPKVLRLRQGPFKLPKLWDA